MTPEEQAAADAAKATADAAQKAADEQAAADSAAESTRTYTHAEMQAEVARVAQKTRLEEQTKRQKALDEEKARSEQERLKQAGEWKTIAEQREAEASELRAQIADRDRDALRVKVGTAAKLPQPLWNRIMGATEAEMAADAAELAKTVAPPTAPNINPGSPANGGGKPTVEAARDRLLKSGDYHRV